MLNYTPEELARARKNGDLIASAAPDGVAFKEWLEGPRGMGFVLLREPQHSDEQIAAAKRWLRSNRDVVFMSVWQPV